MQNKEFTTLAKETCVDTLIEKSRFITTAIPINSVEEAVDFVALKRKQYFDATHNCYAYLLDDKAKFSDAGEPSGTAGLPILECIKNYGVNHVCVVVTRYFGGIKLGTGGLVRAYSGCCAQVLKSAEKVRMTECVRLRVRIDYRFFSALRRAMLQVAKEEQVIFDEKIEIVYLIQSESSNNITDIITQTTFGSASIETIERLICDFGNFKE